MSTDDVHGTSRVSGSIVRGLASYVRRSMGADVLAEILVEVEVEVDADDESLDQTWFETPQLVRFAEVAEARLGDPDLGRRVGEEMFRFRPDLHAFFHAAGDVAEAIKGAVNLGSRTRTAPAFVVAHVGGDHVVVHATARRATRFGCGISAGHWSQIPTLFGTVGTVVEPACLSRGDDRCEFRVSWVPVASQADGSVERSRSRGNTLVSRFEELLNLAAELTAEDTTDGLLHKIAERAVAAVLAPSAVVAVRLADGDPLEVGWSGISEGAAHELANTLDMAGHDADDLDESMALVAISSPRRRYGHLVVIAQAGSTISGNERRMLRAYAGHATAAIEAASALEEARSERDTAESLLGLASKLAGLASSDELADRIAEAVPHVIKCDLAAVMLWDPVPRTLTFAGSWPHPIDALGITEIDIDDVPMVRTIVETRTPAFARAADTDGLLRTLFRAVGARSVAAAPIVIRDEVVGLVIAASTDEYATIDADRVIHRLSGLGDHAATALDNSRLLDRIRHQALHDSLTGLPNRTLIEDRVEHALAVAERVDRWITLLFVDLDRFKEINDELGHAAGDTLLKQLAGRLTACVRASDTVSRLGGDEFLILLENTCGDEDGARVAEKVIDALREPFEINGRSATVSVSIGITSAPGRGPGYEDLLERADQAMYEVKRRGRDGWSVFTPA